MIELKENKLHVLCVLFLIVFVSACEKETKYDVLSGQAIGYVALYDEQRNTMSDNSGVEVILEGSNPRKVVYTDENGQFIFNDILTGTYNVIFKKDGYCQHKIVSFQVVGGNEPISLYQTNLYALPDMNIDNLVITDLEQEYIVYFKVTVEVSDFEDGEYFSLRYYLSDNEDVSCSNYISTDIVTYSINYSLDFNIQIDTNKFPVGSELYMIMYPAYGYQYYIDIETGKEIYTTIKVENASPVTSITIPEIEEYPW